MPPFPAPLAPLLCQRLACFVSQHQIPFADSFSKSAPELARIIRKNATSGRYDRFEKNDKSRARLTPTCYIDRVVENWVREMPRWKKLKQRDNAEWKKLAEWLTCAAAKWTGRTCSLRGFTAEDFAQQAIALMLNAEYPFDVPFDPWALTILHRVIWGKVRSDKDVMDHQPESLDELLWIGDLEGTGVEKQLADPLAHIFAQMACDRDLLWRARAKLNPTLRIVIDLFFFEDLTDEEIARKLNTSTATIQTRRHRGLERLRSILSGKPVSGNRRRQH